MLQRVARRVLTVPTRVIAAAAHSRRAMATTAQRTTRARTKLMAPTTLIVAPAAAGDSSSNSRASTSSSSATVSAATAAAAAAATSPHSALLLTLRSGLAAAGSPGKAAGQKSYMKSEMPFHGVYTPECRSVSKAAFATLTFKTRDEWEATVRHLWDHAQFREERYAALALARMDTFASYQSSLASLPLYKHLVSTGAWWDYCDDLSANHVGEVLRAHPQEGKAEMRRWSASSDLWLRRVAILSQLSHRGAQVDLPFLFEMIQPARSDTTFWLRKAIGWALRQAAREFPREIVAYVAEHEAHLSGLSIAQALKHFGGNVAAAKRKVKLSGSEEEPTTPAAATKKGKAKRKRAESESDEDEPAAAVAAPRAAAAKKPASTKKSAPKSKRKKAE